MRILAVIGFGTTYLLFAAGELKEKAHVSKVEVTTIKSTKVAYDSREREKAMHELDRVRVAAERRGNEVVVTTDFPRHRAFPRPYPLGGGTNFDLEYHIKAPSTARLIANLKVGEVNIDSLVADVQVTLRQGEILLHLPEDGRSNINAKSEFGAVNSDFPGQQKRRWWLIGHRTMEEDSPAAHKLNLRSDLGTS